MRSNAHTYSAGGLSVERLQRRERRTLLRGTITMIGVTGLALLLVYLLGSSGVLLGLLGIGGIVIVAGLASWLWQRPVRGVYVMFTAAVTLDVGYAAQIGNGYYIGHYLPFWMDITAYTQVHIIVSLAELFLALLIIAWLLKGVVQRDLHFERGSLMRPIGLYMGMILVGELHGVASGGNITTSLWEMRAQIYMFAAYVLTCSLVRSKEEITKLTWLLLLGAGFRAIEGTFRYFIYFRGRVMQEVDVFPHEQAFFFNAFITFAAILFLYGGSQRMKRVTLGLLPWVVFIDFAINRRAAIAALAVATVLLLVSTFVVSPARRRASGTILLALAVGFPPYYLVFQNKSGTLATPARAIASQFHPDARDAGSNQYRIAEEYDIMSTMRSSTTSIFIGYGFGKPMLTPQILPDISHIYKWWNIMPHNSIRWVWMRMGTIGYILLWIMIGTAIIQAMGLLRRLQDTRLQGLLLFVALMLVQEVIFGYLDLQWTGYRNLFTVGLLFALISCVTRCATVDGTLAPDDVQPKRRVEKPVRTSTPRSLAVVDGRLKQIDA